MPLSSKEKQLLKAKAHKLRPTVLIGNKSLTPNVLNEIDRALNDHELIKIRIPLKDREERKSLFVQIGASTNAELIGLIGNIGILYRKETDTNAD